MSDQRSIPLLVREGMARTRMSRPQLAHAAQISLSTLEKGLASERPFTLATLVRLEDALHIRLRDVPSDPTHMQASHELGAYRREGVEWLVGTYLTLRPSFERPDAVYAYLTEIKWNDSAGHLVFCERARLDASFAQQGRVSMPYQSGHIYLVTNHNGQFRLTTLGRPAITGNMYGLLSTLRSGRGGRLTPIATPVAFIRQAGPEPQGMMLGLVVAADAAFAAYRAEIDRVCGEEFGVVIA